MPGISFVCDFKGAFQEDRKVLLKSLDFLLHTKEYERKTLLDESFYFLACTRYKEYPFTIFDNCEFRIWLEGEIYGKDRQQVNRELHNLATQIFKPKSEVATEIKEWLLRTDGDFVIVIFDKKSGEVAILNDLLGRLPLYSFYSEPRGQFILSREVRFITNVSKHSKLDRMGIAQYLLFGYPLGERTLFDNIHRLSPACFIRITTSPQKVTIASFNCLNFGFKEHVAKQPTENASELASLFSEGCVNRSNSTRVNVLALSGGLDSRSVAAGLVIHNVPFSAATMAIGDMFVRDAHIAKQLAQIFNITWKLFHLDSPRGKDYLRLLRMKAGLNHLGMSFILRFFDEIKAAMGSHVNYWTGDGGNKLQTSLRPIRKLQSLADLVDYILMKNQLLPLPVVAALTQIPGHEIVDEIEARVSLYPEIHLRDRYLRFYINEKTFKWNFEGEDRNRFYFWSVTPFFSIPFFKYLMSCPEQQKESHKLYREFLSKLSPEVSTIDNANWGCSLGSAKYQIMAMVRRLLLDQLSTAFKRSVKNSAWHRSSTRYRGVFEAQVSNCGAITNYLAPQALQSTIRKCGKTEIETLLTVTSAIEDFECGKSTFEQFYEATFS